MVSTISVRRGGAALSYAGGETTCRFCTIYLHHLPHPVAFKWPIIWPYLCKTNGSWTAYTRHLISSTTDTAKIGQGAARFCGFIKAEARHSNETVLLYRSLRLCLHSPILCWRTPEWAEPATIWILICGVWVLHLPNILSDLSGGLSNPRRKLRSELRIILFYHVSISTHRECEQGHCAVCLRGCDIDGTQNPSVVGQAATRTWRTICVIHHLLERWVD